MNKFSKVIIGLELGAIALGSYQLNNLIKYNNSLPVEISKANQLERKIISTGSREYLDDKNIRKNVDDLVKQFDACVANDNMLTLLRESESKNIFYSVSSLFPLIIGGLFLGFSVINHIEDMRYKKRNKGISTTAIIDPY